MLGIVMLLGIPVVVYMWVMKRWFNHDPAGTHWWNHKDYCSGEKGKCVCDKPEWWVMQQPSTYS